MADEVDLSQSCTGYQAPTFRLKKEDAVTEPGPDKQLVEHETVQKAGCCDDGESPIVQGITKAFCGGIEIENGLITRWDQSPLIGIEGFEDEASKIEVKRTGCGTVRLSARTKGLTLRKCGGAIDIRNGLVFRFPQFILDMEFDESIGLETEYDPARCVMMVRPNENWKGCVGGGSGQVGTGEQRNLIKAYQSVSCVCSNSSGAITGALPILYETAPGLYQFVVQEAGSGAAGTTVNIVGLDLAPFAADSVDDAISQGDARYAAISGCTASGGTCDETR